MDEAIGAAEVNEDTKVTDGRNVAGADFALGELVQQTVLLLGTPLLEGGALGQDDTVPATVNLDDLELELAADLSRQGVGAVRAGLGTDDL